NALGRWACPDADARLEAVVRHGELLNRALGAEDSTNPAEFGQDRWRQGLRRDALWLLCGRDAPDDPCDAVYLDPYEHVACAPAQRAVPPTLVGRAHGDLHGR